MSTLRFSGDVRIRLTLLPIMSLGDAPKYRAFVRLPGDETTVTVSQSGEDGSRLDPRDPMAFDNAAADALGLATDKGCAVLRFMESDGNDGTPVIRRLATVKRQERITILGPAAPLEAGETAEV